MNIDFYYKIIYPMYLGSSIIYVNLSHPDMPSLKITLLNGVSALEMGLEGKNIFSSIARY